MTFELSSAVLSLYRDVLRRPGNDSAIAELALALAESGTIRPNTLDTADIASTGGPSSLTTLLCPLYLANAGVKVPKVGVPGRPAGGIDVLGSVPTYKTSLSLLEFEDALDVANLAHVEAGGIWAPADIHLFRLRQQEGTQANPDLAIASLLSKKIAAGVAVAGLDARISPIGNFGSTLFEGKRNAERFCRVASLLGMRAIVFITLAEAPFQPFIGRAEALMALLQVAHQKVRSALLRRHARLCFQMATILTDTFMRARAGTSLPPRGLANTLELNLRAQGSSVDEFQRRIQAVRRSRRQVLRADREGYAHFDLQLIRSHLTRLQAASTWSTGTYPDGAGIRLLSSGSFVQPGDPVMELRSDAGWPIGLIDSMFSIQSQPPEDANMIHEVVISPRQISHASGIPNLGTTICR